MSPAQAAPLLATAVNTNAAGCVMVKLRVMVFMFASVVVQVYVPAHSPEAVAADPPDGSQE